MMILVQELEHTQKHFKFVLSTTQESKLSVVYHALLVIFQKISLRVIRKGNPYQKYLNATNGFSHDLQVFCVLLPTRLVLSVLCLSASSASGCRNERND